MLHTIRTSVESEFYNLISRKNSLFFEGSTHIGINALPVEKRMFVELLSTTDWPTLCFTLFWSVEPLRHYFSISFIQHGFGKKSAAVLNILLHGMGPLKDRDTLCFSYSCLQTREPAASLPLLVHRSISSRRASWMSSRMIDVLWSLSLNRPWQQWQREQSR